MNRTNRGQEEKSIVKSGTFDHPELMVGLSTNNIWDKVEKKANYLKSDLSAEKNLTNLPNDFTVFSDKYVTDSLFQIQHVDFKYLVGAIAECDTTIILNSENWEYSSWDFIKEFTEGDGYEPIEKWDNSVYISDNRVYFEFNLKEIGLIYQMGFEKINGEWFITLYKINVC